MRTSDQNKADVLSALASLAKATVELHKLLAAADLSEDGPLADHQQSVLNNAKFIVQDAKDRLNAVRL